MCEWILHHDCASIGLYSFSTGYVFSAHLPFVFGICAGDVQIYLHSKLSSPDDTNNHNLLICLFSLCTLLLESWHLKISSKNERLPNMSYFPALQNQRLSLQRLSYCLPLLGFRQMQQNIAKAKVVCNIRNMPLRCADHVIPARNYFDTM